jgi:4-oxalocrotonate tautomerase
VEGGRAAPKPRGRLCDSVSVGIEEVDWKDWTGKVDEPDIIGKAETLYKKPGYGRLR